MKQRELKRLERELQDYVESMVAGMGRVERRAALSSYGKPPADPSTRRRSRRVGYGA